MDTNIVINTKNRRKTLMEELTKNQISILDDMIKNFCLEDTTNKKLDNTTVATQLVKRRL